ncbi:unnamed protein product [Ixodes pacificus]
MTHHPHLLQQSDDFSFFFVLSHHHDHHHHHHNLSLSLSDELSSPARFPKCPPPVFSSSASSPDVVAFEGK